ncbi:MAG: redoxin domain-containing protein [Waterburya sp.]
MNSVPKIGGSAPNFTAKDQHGNIVSLKDKKADREAYPKGNRWLVLYFYPKDNTSGCTTEAKDFSEYNQQFQELGAVEKVLQELQKQVS